MNTNINNTNDELIDAGWGMVSIYSPKTDDTLSIAQAFNFSSPASIDECMQTVASLCDGYGIPTIKDSKEAVSLLANVVLEIDEDWQKGLISEEDCQKDICILMWMIASLMNAKWFEVCLDQELVRFYPMTAEQFAEREKYLAGNEKLAA